MRPASLRCDLLGATRRAARAAGARAGLVVALCVIGAAGGPRTAGAQVTADTTMFAVAATQTLYTVQRTGGATATITAGLSFNTSAIARDPISGRIYYTSTNYGAPATQNGRVAYYDPASGVNQVLLNAGNGDNVVRLAFNQAGLLFGIGSTSPTQLYQISTTTGVMTALGPVKVGSTVGADLGASGDLAFDYDGTLYASASPNGTSTTLYRIATTPSAGVYVATAVGNIVNAIEASLAFGADGRLYTAGSNGDMYTTSTTTAGTTSTVVAGAFQFYDFATSPRFADLGITGSTPFVPIGDTAFYNITVTNAGPQSANGQITVVDSLPANFTYANVTPGWTCVAVGRRVTCTTPGPLAVGASSTFTLGAVVGVAVAVGTSTPNIVRVTGSTIDQDQTDNRFSIPGTAVANIDFTLTKTHAGSFTVGVNGVYTLSAKNVGTTPSVGTITLVDTLPVGLTWVSGVGAGWACSRTSTAPDVVTCTRATAVAAGATVTIALTVAVAQAAAPSVTNTARISGGTMLAPRSASDPTTILFRDVDVTPDAGTATQLPSNGTSYTGSFTLTNTGTLADTYTLTASKVPGTTITITSVNGVAGTTTTKALAIGASAVIPVVYTVANGALAGAADTLKLLATSTAVGTVTDGGLIAVTVMRAGLAMTKSMYRADLTTLILATDIVAPGDTVNYLVTVAATGGAGSTLVHVSDVLPAGVSFISTTPDAAGWTISQATGTVTADLAGTLATGATRSFWIRVKVL